MYVGGRGGGACGEVVGVGGGEEEGGLGDAVSGERGCIAVTLQWLCHVIYFCLSVVVGSGGSYQGCLPVFEVCRSSDGRAFWSPVSHLTE